MGMVDYCMTLHSFSWHLFDSTILFRISYLAPIKSGMETFWYRLTQVHLDNGH